MVKVKLSVIEKDRTSHEITYETDEQDTERHDKIAKMLIVFAAKKLYCIKKANEEEIDD